MTHLFFVLYCFHCRCSFPNPVFFKHIKVFLKNYPIYNLNIQISKKIKRLYLHIANQIDPILTVMAFVYLF